VYWQSGSLLGLDTSAASASYSGVIADPNGVSIGLAKLGGNTLTLSGSNSYSGPTTINSGVLQAVDGVGLPAASNLVFNGNLAQNGTGAVLQSSGMFSRSVGSGPGQVQWTGDGGFAANGGPLTVSMSPGVPLVWSSVYNSNGTPGFLGDLNTLTFGSPTANSQVNLTDSVDLNGPNQNGGNRQIYVAAGTGGDSALISGDIIDSAGGAGLTKAGGGLLILAGTDTYTGGTTVEEGTLIVTNNAALPAGSSLTVGAGGTFVFDPAASGSSIGSDSFQNPHTSVVVEAVPEPGTLALLLVAMGNVIFYLRPSFGRNSLER
jgi:autotransporter-associated beta strand protein